MNGRSATPLSADLADDRLLSTTMVIRKKAASTVVPGNVRARDAAPSVPTPPIRIHGCAHPEDRFPGPDHCGHPLETP